MEIEPAREVVGRQDPLRGDEGTVGAAAHGDRLGFDLLDFQRAVEVVNADAVSSRTASAMLP